MPQGLLPEGFFNPPLIEDSAEFYYQQVERALKHSHDDHSAFTNNFHTLSPTNQNLVCYDLLDILFRMEGMTEYYDSLLTVMYDQSKPSHTIEYSVNQESQVQEFLQSKKESCEKRSKRGWWRDAASLWALHFRYYSEGELFNKWIAYRIFEDELGRLDSTIDEALALRNGLIPFSAVENMILYDVQPGKEEDLIQGYQAHFNNQMRRAVDELYHVLPSKRRVQRGFISPFYDETPDRDAIALTLI